jgi:MoaA/NifB/PqqE/SkfB family radical SAM enzyme
MPWTQSDNAFSWLEITRRCDLHCDYCYQTNNPHSDKDMTTIETELLTLQRLRRCDTMFISGGEPLLHPQLEAIVRLV